MIRLHVLHTAAFPASTYTRWYPDGTPVNAMAESLEPMLAGCTLRGPSDQDIGPGVDACWIRLDSGDRPYIASLHVDGRTD